MSATRHGRWLIISIVDRDTNRTGSIIIEISKIRKIKDYLNDGYCCIQYEVGNAMHYEEINGLTADEVLEVIGW